MESDQREGGRGLAGLSGIRELCGRHDSGENNGQLEPTGLRGMEQNQGGGSDPFDIAATSRSGIDLGPVVETPKLKNRDYGRPICRRHGCLMKANGTENEFTRYKCPVKGCSGREIRVRERYQQMCMREPMDCCQCKDGTVLEIDEEYSKLTPGLFAMKCPKCGSRTQVVRPDVARFEGKKSERLL
jgi:hypothetical protein